METTKLSSKGQVILPKAIRDAHAWEQGTEFVVEETAGGVLLRPRKTVRPTTLDQVAGSLRYSGAPKTTEEMERAVVNEIKDRHDRGRY